MKLWAGPVDTTTRSRIPAPGRPTSSRPHGSPLHTRKPSSSVQAAAGGESSRAPARGRLQRPEGGRRTARMKTRVITLLLAAGLLAVAALTALSLPATAQTQTVYVELADGTVVPVQVDVPDGATLGRHPAAGRAGPHADRARHHDAPRPPLPSRPRRRTIRRRPRMAAAAATPAAGPPPAAARRRRTPNSGHAREPRRDARADRRRSTVGARDRDHAREAPRPPLAAPQPRRHPHASNPGFIDALPGPSTATGVPNFIIRKFRVPPFLLSDLPGRRHRVRRPLGDPRGDQRDRDGLRPQPERVVRRRPRLDAVHAPHLEDVRDGREQGRAQGSVQPGRRDLRRRPLPQGRRLREGRPRARSSPTTTPTGTSTRSSCARV